MAESPESSSPLPAGPTEPALQPASAGGLFQSRYRELPDAAARSVAKLSQQITTWTGRPHERLSLIISAIDTIQKSHLMPYIEARPIIIGRHGMAGYAQIMDRVAAAERELNRAWSAAADGVDDEAVQCVQTAAARFEETRVKMAKLGA